MQDLKTRVRGLVGAERLPSLDHVVSDWLLKNPFHLDGIGIQDQQSEEEEGEGEGKATKEARHEDANRLLQQLDAWLDSRPKQVGRTQNVKEGDEENSRRRADVQRRLEELEKDLFSSSPVEDRSSNAIPNDVLRTKDPTTQDWTTHPREGKTESTASRMSFFTLRSVACVVAMFVFVGTIASFYYFSGQERIGQVDSGFPLTSERSTIQDAESDLPDT